MSKKNFFALVILSFIVQLFLSFYDTYGDTHGYFIPWAQSIEKYGTNGFYQRVIPPNTYPNYPPLIVLVLTAFHVLSSILIDPIKSALWSLNTAVPFFPSGIVTFFYKDNLLLFSFMKLPNILANIALALGIYHLAKEILKNKPKSRVPVIAFVSTLFNPALIYISAMWGQVDVLPFAFLVWSFYLALKKSYNWSVFMMALALLTKQTVILALLFYALYLLNKLTVRRFIVWMVIVYVTFVAIFWPFQKTLWDKFFPIASYLKIAGSFASSKVSMHAHNFWQAICPNMGDEGVRVFSLIMVFGFMAYTIYRIFRKRNDLKYVFAALSVFSVFSFMFMTRMHERHLLGAIPFLLLAVILDFRLYWVFVFESLYLLLNMYAAWPVPYMEFIAKSVNTQWVVNVIVAIELLVLSYAIIIFHKKTHGTK